MTDLTTLPADYTLVEALPANLKGALPTVEEIECELLGSEGFNDERQSP